MNLSGAVAAGGGTNFWTENKDLLALIVSLLALAISIITSKQNLTASRKIAEEAAAHNLKLAKAATYQRIHELLVDPKAAAGRRRLFQAARAHQFPRLGEDGWDEINYSLALYDTLAGYVYREQVDEDVVLDAWHHPLVNIAGPVREFMAHRKTQDVQQPWAHLMGLLAKAEQYRCHCPADAGDAAVRPSALSAEPERGSPVAGTSRERRSIRGPGLTSQLRDLAGGAGPLARSPPLLRFLVVRLSFS